MCIALSSLKPNPLQSALHAICTLKHAAMPPAGANRALGIPDKAFVLVDSVLITGLGRIALMPTLVLCARICPEVRPLTNSV